MVSYLHNFSYNSPIEVSEINRKRRAIRIREFALFCFLVLFAWQKGKDIITIAAYVPMRLFKKGLDAGSNGQIAA